MFFALCLFFVVFNLKKKMSRYLCFFAIIGLLLLILFYFRKEPKKKNTIVLCVWNNDNTFNWFQINTNVTNEHINFHTYELKGVILLKTSWETGQVKFLRKKEEEYQFIVKNKKKLPIIFKHQMTKTSTKHKMQIANECFNLHAFNAIVRIV